MFTDLVTFHTYDRTTTQSAADLHQLLKKKWKRVQTLIACANEANDIIIYDYASSTPMQIIRAVPDGNALACLTQHQLVIANCSDKLVIWDLQQQCFTLTHELEEKFCPLTLTVVGSHVVVNNGSTDFAIWNTITNTHNTLKHSYVPTCEKDTWKHQ
jgi:hypothetical protein